MNNSASLVGIHDKSLLREVARALGRHGAPPSVVQRVADAAHPTCSIMSAAYDELEARGAHPWLLGTVASWRDGLSDAEIIHQLKELNAGTFRFDVIASTFERRGRATEDERIPAHLSSRR